MESARSAARPSQTHASTGASTAALAQALVVKGWGSETLKPNARAPSKESLASDPSPRPANATTLRLR